MKQMKERGEVQHIHLLRPHAFSPRAPHELVISCLNQESENKRKTFQGLKPQKAKGSQDYAKSSSLGGNNKNQSMNRQGSLLLAVAEARQGAKKAGPMVTSPSVIAERDAAYREQLEGKKRLDDFKKALEKDLVQHDGTIKQCRRLYDDYKAEKKEALERRDSEEEGRGRHHGSHGALGGEYSTAGSRKQLA